MRASEYLGPDGPLAASIEGYEHRPSQMQMADAVAETLEHRGVLLVEAGTGTGKTWAYLIPALLSGKKVVISTGTRTLQDQIMEQDVPALREHLGMEVKVACMKGLSNYLCRRRYEELLKSAEVGKGEHRRHLPIVEKWIEETPCGDRTEIEGLPENAPIWGAISSGPDTRIGARCSHYEKCFVTKMRAAAEKAQIIVVNHHLFFADLSMRGPHGGSVIPDYDAVIFDEAHQIEDVATLFFGTSISIAKLHRLARDAERSLDAAKQVSPLPDALRDAAESFFGRLPHARGERENLDQGILRELEAEIYGLDDVLEALAARCREHRAESESLGQITRRCGRLRDELASVLEAGQGRSVGWLSRRSKSDGSLGAVTLGVSPVDVSSILRDELFLRTDAVILTSATLTTAAKEGPFTFLRSRLGIDFEVEEKRLDSPFSYPEQAGLYLTRRMPDPRSPNFVPAAVEQVDGLVKMTGGGAFVLCTSFRHLRALAQECRVRWFGRYRVLVQGQAPKATLLDIFRRDGNAVLFATSSFWEGVDVPGEALRLVVIDKLPFGVPSDPLVRARCERLEEQGGKPFMELLVPSAALTLKQGFGRLIRSRKDRGIVAILDPRLMTKGYGRVFLNSLPDASRLYSLEEAQAFWAMSEELFGTTAASKNGVTGNDAAESGVPESGAEASAVGQPEPS